MSSSRFDYTRDQWTTLRRLLDEALRLPLHEHAAWLDALDGSFDDLKPRLALLLSQAGKPWVDAAINTLPKVETDQFAPALRHADATGSVTDATVGPYRLLREIGHGGMASVWLAERMDMLQQRQVALKLPHGAWRRAGLAARMAREREILATLEHPNIARLYDAGVTEQGQAYLALEYVQGVPIDAFVREHTLGVGPCLRLFLQVCDAVAHAHAHLVVHRDLKPSNILVTPQGQVRLLDFGIAKLLAQDSAEETQLTRDAGRALTPDYAAPEQILGQPIGTAADIYALGVVLFELLTGRRPYALKLGSGLALEDAVAQAEAPRPSDAVADPQRQRELRGDLDTIVFKALKKAPEERYATVPALADDLCRHLQHLPVLARPDSLGYRMRKFARRHRLAVVTGVAVAAALVTGSSLALWQAREAGAQRDLALQAKARADGQASVARRAERAAEAQADLVGFLLADLSTDRSQADMQQQLERALTAVRAQYRDDAFLRARMLLDIAERFRWVSEFKRANLLFAEAEPLLRAQQDASPLARLLCLKARDAGFDGHFDRAWALIAEAKRELARIPGDSVRDRTSCLVEEAAVARIAGDMLRAVAAAEQARTLEVQAGQANDENHAETLHALSRAYFQAGRYRESADAARASIALRTQLGRERTPGMMNMQARLAASLREGGRPLDALAIHDSLRSGTAGREVDTGPRNIQLALTLHALGRHGSLAPMLAMLLDDARNRDDRTTVRAITLLQIQSLLDSGALAQARGKLAEAERLYAKLLADQRYPARLLLFARAEVALSSGDVATAEAAIRQARDIVQRTGQADDPAWRQVHRSAARVHLARGQAEAAVTGAEAALAFSRQQAIDPEASLFVAEDLLLRARAQLAGGHTEQAQADARLAGRHARAAGGDEHPLVRQALALAP